MPNLSSLSAIQKLVLFGVETAYGTDIEPTGTEALLTQDFKIEPAKADKVARNIDRLGFGGSEDAMGPTHAAISYKVPLTGSGTAGVEAAFSDMMRAHQFNTTILATISVTHKLVSGDLESGTIYFYNGDRLRKLTGYRGSIGFSFKKGDIPYIMCQGMALYAPRLDGSSIPIPDYANTQKPKPISFDNTPRFEFGTVDLAMVSYDISPPSNMKHRDAPNQQEVRTNARRNYSGKLTVLQRPLADFDPESLMVNQTLSEIVIRHGTAPGERAILTAPQVQIVGINEGEEDGDATWELDLNIPSSGAGDDDLRLQLT